MAGKQGLKMDIPEIPELLIDNTDRNRTSPFAFTGNRFEFHAIIDVLREDIKTCKPIRFDGNGYSDEWVAEAEKRGLDVEKSCPKIFERYLDEASIKMFESLGVMTKKELEARNEVKWETYTKKIIQEISERTSAIEKGVEELVNARKKANKINPSFALHQTLVKHSYKDCCTPQQRTSVHMR